MLFPELINKILTYNIHPCAELIKGHEWFDRRHYYINQLYRSTDKFSNFPIFYFSKCAKYCWTCHKKVDDKEMFFKAFNITGKKRILHMKCKMIWTVY